MAVLFNSIIILFALFSVTAILCIFKLQSKIKNKEQENEKLVEEMRLLINQKKSSEIRLGKIGENMAPFFFDWPYNPNNFRFLGNPVDGIQFEEDKVIFMEIKTGKARLTDSQKNVKALIKEGKVDFATFRVDETGCKLRLEKEEESNEEHCYVV